MVNVSPSRGGEMTLINLLFFDLYGVKKVTPTITTTKNVITLLWCNFSKILN